MSGKTGKKQEPKRQRILPAGLEKALSERKAGIDSEVLLNDLIEVWGGSRQISIDIHEEFQAAPPGGMVRQRIMELLNRLIMHNTTNDIGRTAKPSDLSKDELEAIAMRYMRKVSGTEGITDASAPAPG